MIKAVLDACVLYPAQLRNFLLRLADNDWFCLFWSDEIQNEWIHNLLRDRKDLKRENLERTRQNMDSYFPNSIVQGYEAIISSLQMPDMNDRHVLAAAIHIKAEYIVTFNLNDFPKSALQYHGIESISPDELTLLLIQEAPFLVLQAAETHRLSLTRPSLSVTEYLTMLEKQRLPKTVDFLRMYENNF